LQKVYSHLGGGGGNRIFQYLCEYLYLCERVLVGVVELPYSQQKDSERQRPLRSFDLIDQFRSETLFGDEKVLRLLAKFGPLVLISIYPTPFSTIISKR